MNGEFRVSKECNLNSIDGSGDKYNIGVHQTDLPKMRLHLRLLFEISGRVDNPLDFGSGGTAISPTP